MTIRERVPKSLRGPLGFGSLGVTLVAIAVGYILTVMGAIFTAGLGAPSGASRVESATVLVVGIVCLFVAYLGWKGFTHFAY